MRDSYSVSVESNGYGTLYSFDSREEAEAFFERFSSPSVTVELTLHRAPETLRLREATEPGPPLCSPGPCTCVDAHQPGCRGVAPPLRSET